MTSYPPDWMFSYSTIRRQKIYKINCLALKNIILKTPNSFTKISPVLFWIFIFTAEEIPSVPIQLNHAKKC